MAAQPPNGKYYIVKKETTPDGKLLAITYNGENAPLTVSELGYQPNQAWVFTDGVREGLQAVSPLETGLKVEVEDTVKQTLQPVEARGISWTIKGAEGQYTFRNADLRFFWTVKEVKEGQELYTGPESLLYFWRLIYY